MGRKMTHAEHVADIAKVNPDVEILGKIINCNTKVLTRCKICGYEWLVVPSSLKKGYGCPECGKIKNANKRRLTNDEQVAAINKVNPNVEILEEIKSVNKKVLCRCKVCGHEWSAKPSHLKSGHGCPKCSGGVKLSHEEHAEAIAKVNPDVEVIGKIKNARTKVLCLCKICGHEWEVTPDGLKRGHGCPECAKIKVANARRLTHAENVADIEEVNPDVEVLEKIIDTSTKVLCRCKIHDYKWKVRPYDLKMGQGCPECKKEKIANKKRFPHTEHVAAINKVNPDVDVLGEIINAVTKVLCRCKICGYEWMAKPAGLKAGRGCPRCAKNGFLRHDVGKLYIMVDDLNVPTMMKIGVSVREDRSKQVLQSAHKAGVNIPALHVAKTWEGPTELMMRIEQMMHENYEEWNIKFPAKFDGYKEFFYYTHETAAAFDVIEETIHEIINANQAA
ncbi:zinc-ribbon domain-containing protein [Escherichia coli]